MWTHMGMRNMLAITWSKPNATKVVMGHQIATILETISREDVAMKTARHTNQFAAAGSPKVSKSNLAMEAIIQTSDRA